MDDLLFKTYRVICLYIARYIVLYIWRYFVLCIWRYFVSYLSHYFSRYNARYIDLYYIRDIFCDKWAIYYVYFPWYHVLHSAWYIARFFRSNYPILCGIIFPSWDLYSSFIKRNGALHHPYRYYSVGCYFSLACSSMALQSSSARVNRLILMNFRVNSEG